MKYIIAAVTLLSVLWAAWPDIEGQSATKQGSDSLQSLTLNQPAQPAGELTALEKRWQENLRIYQEQQAKLNQPTEQKQPTSSHELLVAGKRFLLLGIFSNNAQPFILIREDGDVLKRINVGEPLAENISLVAISGSNISLLVDSQRQEFKLFQRQENDTQN